MGGGGAGIEPQCRGLKAQAPTSNWCLVIAPLRRGSNSLRNSPTRMRDLTTCKHTQTNAKKIDTEGTATILKAPQPYQIRNGAGGTGRGERTEEGEYMSEYLQLDGAHDGSHIRFLGLPLGADRSGLLGHS